MECQDCVDSVSLILSSLGGINSFNVSLKDQSVVVEGTIAPSKITEAIRGSGRAAILRGSGEAAGDGLGSRSCIGNGADDRCGSVYPGLSSAGQSSSRCERIS